VVIVARKGVYGTRENNNEKDCEEEEIELDILIRINSVF